MSGRNARSRQRFASRRHAMQEREARLRRRAISDETIEPHDPMHETGCPRCFVARQQARRRGDGQVQP